MSKLTSIKKEMFVSLGLLQGFKNYKHAPKTLIRNLKKHAPKINTNVCFTKIL